MARVRSSPIDRPSLARRLLIEGHAVWLAARDPRTPLPARLLGWFVAGYALSPIDLIPDFIPVIGLLDDAIIVPLGIWLFERMVPPDLMAEHRATATAASTRPHSMAGVALVLAGWAVAVMLGYLLVGLLWG